VSWPPDGSVAGLVADRQADRSRATKAELVATARRLFAERGYANVSAAEIVTEAGLSRGALYHHYADKADLFRAVLLRMEVELTDEIHAAATDAIEVGGIPAGMLGALDAFLSACERDEVVRIMLVDAPAVLGWRAWRAIEADHALGMIIGMLEGAVEAGLLAPQPIPVLAQLMLSAVIEGALLVADAPDRATARLAVRQGLVTLFAGLAIPLPE
jgi:AcrR family transcriptional regulator